MGNFAQEAVEKIRHQVGKDEVILGLSGGSILPLPLP